MLKYDVYKKKYVPSGLDNRCKYVQKFKGIHTVLELTNYN